MFAWAIAVPVQTPATMVPTLVSEEVTTPLARVVPVNVPAAAATVQVDWMVHVWPLTVVDRPLTVAPDVNVYIPAAPIVVVCEPS